MDINLIRIIVTVSAFAAFLVIVWWAYAPSRKAAWEKKAVLEGDDLCPPVKGAHTPLDRGAA